MDKLVELWKYRGLVYNLVVRDLKVRYKNSVLGVAWSWLNPLLMMLIFTVVFNFLAGNSALENYHIFVLCALLPWNFFSASISSATVSVIGNSHLIKKVYFPREVLPIAVVLSNLVNFLMALPVLFGLALLFGVRFTPWILLLPVSILIQVVFTLGVCFITSTIEVFFRDMHSILDVLIQAWFFVTPILYPITQVPEEATLFGVTFNAHLWLRRLNPMASVIASYRDLLYWGSPTGLDFLLRTAVTAVVFLVIGYLIFQRYSPRFAEEV